MQQPPPRYEVLYRIPETMGHIHSKVTEANGRSEGSRAWKKAIAEACRLAHEMLVELTDSPPLWLALQRQVLVRGWSFADLEELRPFDLRSGSSDLVKVLTGLQVERRSNRKAIEDTMRNAVDDAFNRFRQVQAEAALAARARGIALPRRKPEVIGSMLVDETHSKMWELRELLATLAAVKEPEKTRLSDADWNSWLLACAAAATIVAAITTVAVQAPEVWGEIEAVGAYLAEAFGWIRDAIDREIALLGMVIAIRQSDDALALISGDSIRSLREPGPEPPIDDRGSRAVPVDGEEPRWRDAQLPSIESPVGEREGQPPRSGSPSMDPPGPAHAPPSQGSSISRERGQR